MTKRFTPEQTRVALAVMLDTGEAGILLSALCLCMIDRLGQGLEFDFRNVRVGGFPLTLPQLEVVLETAGDLYLHLRGMTEEERQAEGAIYREHLARTGRTFAPVPGRES